MGLMRPARTRAKFFLETTTVLAMLAVPTLAFAQDGGTANNNQRAADDEVDAIIVTARRVGEDVQDIPISVGTLDASSLQARAITNFQDLKASIAGLTTQKTGTAGGGFTTIRGLTPVASPQPASDQGVGFFVDGVYIARSQGSGAPLVDVSRVEVLRGPQGTLFGRNSSIGTINFITNLPTENFEGLARVEAGNYDAIQAEAMLNIPVTSNLIARFAYLHKEMDGDVKNTTTAPGFIYGEGIGAVRPAKAFDNSNSDSYLAKLRYTGIQDVTIDYKYDREEMEGSANANQLIGFAPTSGLLGLLSVIYPAQAPGAVQQSFTRLSSLSEDHTGGFSITNQGHLLSIEGVLSDALTARSITAYRSTKSGNSTDLDGGSWFFPARIIPGLSGPLCVSCSTNNLKQHAWSQELQLLGKAADLSYTLGGYYFDEHATFSNTYSVMAVMPYAPVVYQPTSNVTVVRPLNTPGDRVLGNDGIYDNRSVAVYGHIDYKFSDLFDISAGARYTWDDRRTNDLRSFGSGLSKYKDSRLTYDAALNLHLESNKMVYLKFGSGYTSGGVDRDIVFKPEVNDQLELGFKGEFLDRKLRFNASAYYSWVKNRQTTVPNTSSGVGCSPVLIAAGFTPGACPVGLFVFNLPGTSKFKGFEIETEFRPVHGLTLTANYAYNDPKFSTGEFIRAPRTNVSLSAQYNFPEFNNGSHVSVRFDGDYRSKYFGTGGNVDASFVGTVPAALRGGLSNDEYIARLRDASVAGGYWLVNGRIALAEVPLAGNSNLEIAGYVRNITNTKDPYYTVNYGASFHASYERPRTYGATATVRF